MVCRASSQSTQSTAPTVRLIYPSYILVGTTTSEVPRGITAIFKRLRITASVKVFPLMTYTNTVEVVDGLLKRVCVCDHLDFDVDLEHMFQW